jgi:hypothetical protein
MRQIQFRPSRVKIAGGVEIEYKVNTTDTKEGERLVLYCRQKDKISKPLLVCGLSSRLRQIV